MGWLSLVMWPLAVASLAISSSLVPQFQAVKFSVNPRALFTSQEVYTAQLIFLQVVVFVVDTGDLVWWAWSQFKSRFMKPDLFAPAPLETSGFSNFCIYFMFLVLTKGIAAVFSIVMCMLTVVQISDATQTYFYEVTERGRINDLAGISNSFITLLAINFISIILLCIGGCTGFFEAGSEKKET
eukprot:GILI01022013.1.p1 GENE.GILI01022013.1~~GILI01022013.1.p1  ORF type:complete len:201 (-),score=30.56 GILI01022013.1:343-894(-)